MSVYLITYDLNKPVQEYDKLYLRIEGLGEWNHFMESNWFISTDRYDAKGIQEELMEVLDQNDSLFVTKINPDRSGWILKKNWNWLDQRQ